jgi:hypothetical protein
VEEEEVLGILIFQVHLAALVEVVEVQMALTQLEARELLVKGLVAGLVLVAEVTLLVEAVEVMLQQAQMALQDRVEMAVMGI